MAVIGLGHFDYQTASEQEILARAGLLVGQRLNQVVDVPGLDVPPSAHTKGVVGAAYEAFFGIPPNSRSEADFSGACIELKSTAIIQEQDGPRAKERVSLGMIDYATLPTEDWQSASVRGKLERLLFCFYRWSPDSPIGEFVTLATGLWQPSPAHDELLAADWVLVRDLVRAGRTAEVSEALGRRMGAATKGSGGAGWEENRRRAWALKPPFVVEIYTTLTQPSAIAANVAEVLAFEERQLALLRSVEGRTVRSLAGGRAGGLRAKNAAATVVRGLLGLRPRGRPEGSAWTGIEVKTVPVSPNGRPYEHTSFPAFSHMELVEQDWEDSDLLARVSRILFIPLVRDRREQPALDSRIGRAFF
jgi:DNA mismatch repair protein MutH